MLKLKSFALCQQKALHMRSLKTFKDDFGVVRKNGEEWLIKMSDTETHIPNVYEEVSHAAISEKLTHLVSTLSFCFVCCLDF